MVEQLCELHTHAYMQMYTHAHLLARMHASALPTASNFEAILGKSQCFGLSTEASKQAARANQIVAFAGTRLRENENTPVPKCCIALRCVAVRVRAGHTESLLSDSLTNALSRDAHMKYLFAGAALFPAAS